MTFWWNFQQTWNERRIVWMTWAKIRMHSQRASLYAWCCCLTPQSAASLTTPAAKLNKLKCSVLSLSSDAFVVGAVYFLLKCLHQWTLGSWTSFKKTPCTHLVLLSGTSIMSLSGKGSLCRYSTWSKFKSTTSPCDTSVLKEVGYAGILNNFHSFWQVACLSKKSPSDTSYHQLYWKGACQIFQLSLSSSLLKTLKLFFF